MQQSPPPALKKTEQPRWAAGLYQPHRYKVIYGGRGSGKTWAVAMALVILGARTPLRIACTRQFQNSLDESAKQTIEIAIRNAGLSSFYQVKNTTIDGGNGTHFFFKGLERNAESIKGWERVDIVWVEEAQKMSQKSWEILVPTIRKAGSELWFTFNPTNRTDPVWQAFVVRKRDGAYLRKVNFMDNPFFPPELKEERRIDQLNRPDRYPHIWLGLPDDESGERRVLPWALIEPCVDAHRRLGLELEDARCHVGLDVADTGADQNALVARRGPLVEEVQSWSSKRIGDTARRANSFAIEAQATRVYYDSGGVGAGVRSYFSEITERDYKTYGVNFGGAVEGKNTSFNSTIKNAQYFSRVNSQMAWALYMRAQNTARLLNGEETTIDRCLFIDSRIKNLNNYLEQLTQPTYKEDTSGRIVIEKSPDDMPSPDKFDATCLAFYATVVGGLHAKWF